MAMLDSLFDARGLGLVGSRTTTGAAGRVAMNIPADAASLVEEIDRELALRGTADRAVNEKAYLKSDLEHYGTTVPVIRSIVKTINAATTSD